LILVILNLNRRNIPGPGTYEQESDFDRMIERERIRKKKQGSHSVNPTLSHIVSTSNTTLNFKELPTSESTVIDTVGNKGNFNSK
jgi:hypothetical protein